MSSPHFWTVEDSPLQIKGTGNRISCTCPVRLDGFQPYLDNTLVTGKRARMDGGMPATNQYCLPRLSRSGTYRPHWLYPLRIRLADDSLLTFSFRDVTKRSFFKLLTNCRCLFYGNSLKAVLKRSS